MSKLRKWLAPCEDFCADTAKYTCFDTMLAILFVAAYTLLLIPVFRYNPEYSWAAAIVKLVAAPFVVYIVVLLRGQGAASLGLHRQGLGKSAAIGAVACVIAMPLSALLCLAFGQRFSATPWAVYLNLMVLFVNTGIPEELVARGFVGKRLYGGIKSKPLALVLGGVLFAVWHLPSMVAQYGGAWFAIGWPTLVFCVPFHIVAMLLYAKTNNLAAPILLHTFWNLVQTCFN